MAAFLESSAISALRQEKQIMDYTKMAIETFSDDVYAVQTTGVRIVAADVNYAKCS